VGEWRESSDALQASLCLADSSRTVMVVACGRFVKGGINQYAGAALCAFGASPHGAAFVSVGANKLSAAYLRRSTAAMTLDVCFSLL